MNEMNEPDIPQSLRLYRGQLREAVARDLSRPRGPLTVLARLRPRRRRGFVAYAVGAAAAVALTVALVTAGGPVQSADAAILHHVAAALTPPAGTVLHETGTITLPGQAAQSFELWAQADPPYGVTAGSGPVGGAAGAHQATTNSSATVPAVAGARLRPRTPRRGGGAPRPRAVGERQRRRHHYDRRGRGLRAEGQRRSQRQPRRHGYVAQSDYRPLLIQTTSGETISYSTYEYLPSSAYPSPGN